MSILWLVIFILVVIGKTIQEAPSGTPPLLVFNLIIQAITALPTIVDPADLLLVTA